MTRISKLVLLLALGGAGYAAWQYNLLGLAMNAWHPQTQAAGGPGAGGQGGKPKSFPIAVKLAQVTKTDFPLIERSYGNLASPQVVGINARVASQIIKVNVTDGQIVKAGDVLVELDDRALQATLAKDQATLAKDETQIVNNTTILQRAQTLATRNAGAQQDVDNATAALQSAQQQVEADKATVIADQLQLDFAKVTAPFDGKLGAVTAVPGQLVAASTNSVSATNLMTITQMQPLKVNFRLPEQILEPLNAAMAKGAKPVVRVYASGTHDLLDTGELNFVDSAVDASTGTIGLAGDVGNDKLNLWPGQRVDVEMEYGKTSGAITVPAVAIQQGQQGSYVWTVDPDNKAKAQPVKVARFEGDLAQIADGVSEGMQVVVEGQAKLANGTEVRTGKPADAAPAADAKPKDQSGQNAEAGGAQAATPPAKEAKKTGTSGETQQ